MSISTDSPESSASYSFRLSEANLPQLPAFPQLLRRVFRWCYAGSAAPDLGPDTTMAEPKEFTLPNFGGEREDDVDIEEID